METDVIERAGEGAVIVADAISQNPIEDLRRGDEADGPAVTGTNVAVSDDLADLTARARRYAEESRSEATRRAYRSDWAHFAAWAGRVGLAAVPASPETVATYLVAYADRLSVSTLTRRISSIATANRMAGHVLDKGHPALRDTWRGIRRDKGTAQRSAAALTTPLLLRLLATCGERLLDRRDRALLLVGFAGAFRRSELCGLDLADATVSDDGLMILLRRSKGDQEGEGVTVAISRTHSDSCPVAAFVDWITAAGISNGRAWRSVDRHGRIGGALSTRAVAQIVQARATAAGLDACTFSGHSLRSGFATAAAAAGVEERVIMGQTRHRSVAVARRYIRGGERWSRNLAAEVGL